MIPHAETVFDIAFSLGLRWKEIPEGFRETLMEELEGSRGLADLVVDWATKFDAASEGVFEDGQKSYIEEVEDFARAKINELIAGVVTERLQGDVHAPRQVFPTWRA